MEQSYPSLDRVKQTYLGSGEEFYQIQLCDDLGCEIVQVSKEDCEKVSGLDVLFLFLEENGGISNTLINFCDEQFLERSIEGESFPIEAFLGLCIDGVPFTSTEVSETILSWRKGE